ncbi:MAG: DUF3307 domain-containing protein [Minisyncoccia bacterium]
MNFQFFTPLELFVIVHFIGDFILQNSWMAANKNKSLFALGVHSFVYALVFIPLLIYYHFTYPVISFFILFVSHFIIDKDNLFISFLENLKRIKKENYSEVMWRIILLVNDQLLHLLVIVLLLLFNIKQN